MVYLINFSSTFCTSPKTWLSWAKVHLKANQGLLILHRGAITLWIISEKLGGAPGNALLFLQCWHSGGYVGLGPSSQSVCLNGARQLPEQVQRYSNIEDQTFFYDCILWAFFFPFCWISDTFRRCSSYQDFTQIGGSSESVEFPKAPSDGEGPSQKHRHVSRALSEPCQLTGGRMGMSHSEQRGRQSVRQRNSRLSNHLCVWMAY